MATGENDITISNHITRNNTVSGALVLQAGRSIIFNSSADVTGLGGGAYSITLNADSNADGVVGGAISLGSGTVFTSAGGFIRLGGGADPLNVAAIGTGANVEGVLLDNAQLFSGAGAISIRGRGNNSAGDNRYGVSIANGSVVESSTGLVAITGLGGNGGSLNIGVDVNGTGSRVTSTGAGGNISITGTGGTGTGDSNVGVAIRSGGATVNSTGTGTITIAGTRGSGAANNESIYIDGNVTSVTGNIQVTGNAGGTVTAGNNTGITLAGGVISSTGAATVTLTGTGGAGTINNHGIRIVSSGDVTSTGGAISLTGTGGGTGATDNNNGVYMGDAGTTVAATNAATVAITGTGNNTAGNNMNGVRIGDGAAVSAVNGNIVITGTAGASGLINSFGVHLVFGGSVISTGAGDISITGTGAGGYQGIDLELGTNLIGGGSATGDILLRSLGGTGIRLGVIHGLDVASNVTTTGNVTLNAVGGGAVSQFSGAITADGLRLLTDGTATFSLNSTTNNVTTLAAGRSTGAAAGTLAITYTDAGALAIGTVTSDEDAINTGTATAGLTTFGSNADIRTLTGAGALALDNNVNAGVGTVYLTAGGSITQAGTANLIAASLGLNAGGAVDVTTATNNVGTLSATTSAGTIAYRDADALTIGAVAATGNYTGTTGLTTTGTATDLLLQTGGALALTQNLTAANAGDVRLASGAGISQTGGAITADLLGLTAAGAIDVTTATNDAVTLAATTSAGTIAYRDANALTVGTVGAQTVSNASFTSTTGLTTTGTATDLLLQTGGALALTQNLTAANAGDVRLASGAGISQTGGAITADLLGLTAAGAIDVTTATNDAVTLAATTSAGTIAYRDANALTVGTVGAQTVSNASFTSTSGLTTTGTATDLLLQTGGALALTQNLTAANAGDVRLASGAGISQTGGAITADLLGLTAAGAIDVTTATNDAVTLAATTSAGTIAYRDANALTVGTVGAQTVSNASFTSTSGLTTTGTGSNITLTTGGALTANNNLSTLNGGTVTLTNAGLLTINANIIADGAITQDGAGDVEITGSRTISTTSGAVDFLRGVTLNGAGSTVAINTTAAGTGGNITFQSTLKGTTAENLTLTAGTTGNITFAGTVGATRLGDVNIASANDVTASAGFAATTLLQTAGSGTTTFNGAVDTSAIGGISLTGTNLVVNNTVTTTNGGTITVSESGTATFTAAGDITSDGAVSLTATGGILTGGDITTTSDAVNYASATTLTGDVLVTTGNGTVAFGSTLDSEATEANDLTLTTGTGAVTFGGPIGSAVNGALGTLTINNSAVTGQILPATAVQTLTLTTNGAITDTGNVVVSGNTTLTPGAGNSVTLDSAGNDFGGAFAVTNGVDVTVVDATGLNLGAINITNDLTVTATTGDITNTGGALTIGGDSLFTASAAGASISVDHAGNNFTGTVTFAPATGLANVSVVDNSAFDLVGISLSGNLTVNAFGPITDSGPSVVPGVSSFNANGFSIMLDAPGNNFSTVQLNGSAITLFNVSSINIAGVQATGALNLQTGGTLTVSSAINGGSTVNLGSTGGDILVNAPVNSVGAMTLTAAQNILATAPGNITTSGGSFTATATAGFVQLSGIATAGGSVTVTAPGSATFISALDVSGAFLVSTGGAVAFNSTLTGNGSLTVNTPANTALNGAINGLGSLLTDAPGSTSIGGGLLGVTSFFRFNDPVTLTNSLVISGPTGRFNTTLNGGQALTVNLTGDALFLGAVGGIAPLASITTDTTGAIRFYGGVVATTGAQTYNDAVRLGANTTFTATNLTFNNTINTDVPLATLSPLGGDSSAASTGESDLIANVSGATVFNAPVGQTSRVGDVTTNAGGTTTVRANFSATRIAFNDAVTIESLSASPITINTTGTQVYAGPTPVQLNTNLTFSSAASSTTDGIRFNQGVLGAGRTLQLDAPGATVVSVGDMGASTGRFTSITANARNMAVGADIWAENDIRLSIGTNNSNDFNDFLQFTVPGSTATHDTRIDSASGVIILGSGAVTGSTAKTTAPFRSSIFKSNPGDLLLFARKVTIQPFERLVVRNGSLIILADGTAATDGITLSNTAATGFLVLASSAPFSVASPTAVSIRSRAPLPAINQDGSNTTTADNGTDLIAGGVFFYTATSSALTPMPTRTAYSPAAGANSFNYTVNKGNILAGTGPGVVSILPDAGGVRQTVFIADLVTSNSFRPVVPNLSYLDLSTVPGFASLQNQFITPDLFGSVPLSDAALRAVVSVGAAPRDVLEQAFTPNVPRTDNTVTPPDADLAAAVREQLQILGIYARAITEDERKDRDRWIAKFVTIPAKVRPAESDYQVADARVEDRAVREVLRTASEAGLLGGESEKQLDAVALALNTAFQTYRSFQPETEPSPEQLIAGFSEWLRESEIPEAQVVVTYARALSRALRQIELLGLTRQELEVCKSQVYGSVLRSRLNVDPEFFRRVVESLASATVAVAQQEPAKEPVGDKPTASDSTGS